MKNHYNSIKVSFPQGAGGLWLSYVLQTCIDPKPWQDQTRNFHNTPQLIHSSHSLPESDSVISIGTDASRYDFWRVYCHKSIIHEVPWCRINQHRLPISPYQHTGNPRDDFFWLINQCRHIQSYQYQGQFKVLWRDVVDRPIKAWNTVCDFLQANNIKNQVTFAEFEHMQKNYVQTCAGVNNSINRRHKLFQIWCLALLQEHQVLAPFDTFENFDSKIMQDWFAKNRDLIQSFTLANLYKPAKCVIL
jgi:hypothetical protein